MTAGRTSVICTTCWSLRRTGDHVDNCGCSGPPGERTVAQVEAGIGCGFCYICGLATYVGHTRWLTLPCEGCKPRVLELNRRHGMLVLPLGIHSIVNGTSFRPNRRHPTITLAQAVAFSDQLNASFAAVGAARAYGRRLLRERCERFGLDGHGDIDALAYLQAAKDTGLTRDLAWRELEAYLATCEQELLHGTPLPPDTPA